jgi:hypothetical protein
MIGRGLAEVRQLGIKTAIFRKTFRDFGRFFDVSRLLSVAVWRLKFCKPL